MDDSKLRRLMVIMAAGGWVGSGISSLAGFRGWLAATLALVVIAIVWLTGD